MKKYQIIYKDLEKLSMSKSIKWETFSPTEQELVQSYQVSRDTIRKALTLLVEEGLVKKFMALALQVINQEQINFPVSDLTSYQELMEQQGIDSQTNVISLDKIIVDSKLSEKLDSPVANKFGVLSVREWLRLYLLVDIDYLDAKLIPQLNRDIAKHSIYDYLEKSSQPQYFPCLLKKSLSIMLTEQDKILIDLGKDLHVVCIRSKVYLSNGKQFQFTESRHKLEKFKFVDYAKRHPLKEKAQLTEKVSNTLVRYFLVFTNRIC